MPPLHRVGRPRARPFPIPRVVAVAALLALLSLPGARAATHALAAEPGPPPAAAVQQTAPDGPDDPAPAPAGAVPAAAPAGAEEATHAPAADSGPEAERRALDAALTQRLRRIFAQVDELEGVRVEVRSGVVRLSGETPSSRRSDQAEELARGLDGVVFVDNDIAETRDLRRRLRPGITRLGETLRELLASLPMFAVALALVLLAWFLARRLTAGELLVGRLSDRRLVQDLARQVIRSVIVLAALFVALDLLDATAVVGAVLGTAGVVGLALSFAFRDIVENYLASILLSLRSPFRAKDLVRIGDTEGVVVRLTTSETLLMTLDGNHVRLPNAAVFKATILNITRNPRRRFDFVVGVGVDEDLDEAQRLGLQTMGRLPGLLDDPAPFALVEALGDSNVALRFFAWVDQRAHDFGKLKSQAITLVKAVFDEHGVDMPAPTYELNLHGAAPGERAPEAAPRRRRPGTEEALADALRADTSPDREIEEQIEAEKAASDEEDLLPDAAPPASRP